MRVKRAPPAWSELNSNGNVLILQSQPSAVGARNRGRSALGDRFDLTAQRNLTDETNNFVGPFNIADDNNPTAGYNDNFESSQQTTLDNVVDSFGAEQVCNQQYKKSLRLSANLANKNHANEFTLEGANVLQPGDSEVAFADNPVTPHDEEEPMLEQSDTDEASDSTHVRQRACARLPRGIVNPNYPGFQHLAHTLQDYSKTIENFYHSENEMTDDDLDAEVIDLSFDGKDEEDNEKQEPNSILSKLSNNNNQIDSFQTPAETNSLIINHKNINLNDDEGKNEKNKLDILCENKNNRSPGDEIPDLLKNVHKSMVIENNNVVPTNTLISDADIENNFFATPIIGDFNKEVEEEINNIFKNNCSFQEDLRELRKEIETAFKKPIEDTINHISEVVNEVIKQLVLEQGETLELNLKNIYNSSEEILEQTKEDLQVSRENETNSKKEMKLSRPTFLFIENNLNSKTLDAFLSDGKDEIHILDEDYEKGLGKLSLGESTYIQSVVPLLAQESPSLLVDKEKGYSSSTFENTSDDAPISIDDNFNEISGIEFIEASGQSLVEDKKNKSLNKIHIKEELTKEATEKDIDTLDARENHSTVKVNYRCRRERLSTSCASTSTSHSREKAQGKKSVQSKEKHDDKLIGNFDVYNIETAMPKLDLDAIESHLKAAKEAERRKRNDREEIRRRLAMGADTEELVAGPERPGRKPSLHSRLQGGMNLQICFMNETVSDNESQNSDSERSPSFSSGAQARGGPTAAPAYSYMFNHPYQTRPLSTSILRNEKTPTGAKIRPSTLSLKPSKSRSSQSLGHVPLKEADFHALQATLQTEARVALAQAKEMARIHMERERRCRAASPVTEMLRKGLEKANAPLAADRRRVSRHLLTDMNVAQLQVIVNSLHGEVELLSEALVRLLMARDELHMGQDSMLVDIEDLTRYLGVKEQGCRSKMAAAGKSGVRRLAALVHK